MLSATRWLLLDGLTVSLVIIPTALAYAALAGLTEPGRPQSVGRNPGVNGD